MKKKLKLFLIILLLIVSLVTLTACGDDEDYDDDDEETTIVDEVKKKEIIKDKEEKITMSERDAKRLIEEYYDVAESLYFLSSDYFDIEYDENEYVKYPINDYEEVINNYISKKFQKSFYPALLIKEGGKYYLGIGGFAKSYENLRFEDVEIEEDKISCTVVLDLYVAGDELLGKNIESNFSIVSENGTWKIDDYTSYEALDY